jgi:O-antigen/teichoic acid export membrane protein
MPPWKMMRYSFPLASANIFSALAMRVDIFMLAGLSGVHSVEVYTVVCMIGKSLTSIRQSFENVLLSTFSSWAKRTLSLKLKHYFNYSIWLVMNVQSIFLAFVVFFGAESLGLVSAQYAAGYWVLVATAVLVYVNTVSDFSVLLALGLGRTTIVPLAQVFFFGANLGLNILLIPRFDALGAALALGLANLTAGTIYFTYLALYYKTSPALREYWISILAGALLIGVPAVLAIHFGFGLIGKAACLVFSLSIGFVVQRTWYRRFNRILHALPEEA